VLTKYFSPQNKPFTSFSKIRQYLIARRKEIIREINADKGIFPTDEELAFERGPSARMTKKRPRQHTKYLKQPVAKRFTCPSKSNLNILNTEIYFGTVTALDRDAEDPERILYHVEYEDGDSEDLYEEQVQDALRLYTKEHGNAKSNRKNISWKPPLPVGTRKNGFWGCGKCRWYPKGCASCRGVDYVSKPPPLLPPGTICGVQPSQQLKDAFKIVSDSRQSDSTGYGIIAKRSIKFGEVFVDNTAVYVSKTPEYARAHLGLEDYISHGKSGYYQVRELVLQHVALTFFLNMAGYTEAQKRSGQTANIAWVSKSASGRSVPSLKWKVIADIEAGEEILVDYQLGGRR
jgi:hypothetical protein